MILGSDALILEGIHCYYTLILNRSTNPYMNNPVKRIGMLLIDAFTQPLHLEQGAAQVQFLCGVLQVWLLFCKHFVSDWKDFK